MTEEKSIEQRKILVTIGDLVKLIGFIIMLAGSTYFIIRRIDKQDSTIEAAINKLMELQKGSDIKDIQIKTLEVDNSRQELELTRMQEQIKNLKK